MLSFPKRTFKDGSRKNVCLLDNEFKVEMMQIVAAVNGEDLDCACLNTESEVVKWIRMLIF